jgi:predicted enzyme related to lactoylglutathione lyase
VANPVTWFEIIGSESTALQGFYKNVFDWKVGAPTPEMGNYALIDNEGQGIGGGIGGTMAPQDQPRVTIYIQVDDPDAYLAKIEAAGGRTLMPTTNVMEGVTIAMFADPSGNVMGLLKAM